MKQLLFVIFLIMAIDLNAQMEINGQVLYGNEWIDYEKSYVKIAIDQDGVYRVSRTDLAASGLPVNQISFRQLRIYHLGESVGFLIGGNDSYIEFYGERNRSELDQFLYMNEAAILNPEYSVASDVSAYFVTWENGINPLIHTETTIDLSNNSLLPESHYMHRELAIKNQTQYKPPQDSEEVRFSNFVASEGYGTGLQIINNVSIPISALSEANVNGSVRVRYGANRTAHRTNIEINGELMETVNSSVNIVNEKTYEVSKNHLSVDSLRVKVQGTLSNADKNIIAFAELIYPRNFNVNGASTFMFNIAPSNVDRYYEIRGYELSDLPYFYNIDESVRIVPAKNADGSLGIILPSSSKERRIYMYSAQQGIKSPLSIRPRGFVDYKNPDYNYILISSEILRNQDNVDWVQEYADYRASETGGGYKPVVVDVEQLYDQYAYGVDRHFIALRNFGFWTKVNYTKPEFMFIIGKGREYRDHRTKDQIEQNVDAYVPTWGNPGSDNMILASDSIAFPLYPVGRLAARDHIEIQQYLQKVKDHDLNRSNPSTITDRLWQKKVLHLSGGDNNIQQLIFNNLSIMADTVVKNLIGADVTTYRKKSEDAIPEATSDLIFDQIKHGLSIITFFGHASVGTFDFNLDNVDNYQNVGKYPILLSLGCFSGNIHTPNGGISESFVLAKDKGSIAFLAASGTAYIGVQNQFGREFYSQIGGAQYGKPLGSAIRATMEKYKNFSDYSYVTFYQQLTLHGDPAIILPSFETPDYIPDSKTIRTDPKFIDTYEESFKVCLDIVNIGRFSHDTINVKLTHLNPSGGLEYEEVKRIVGPGYRKELCYTIPINSNELVGKNIIKVFVDSDNEVNEEPAPDAELNNILRNESGSEGFEFFILNNSAVPTFPEEFAIVNTSQVSLIASTFNALAEAQDIFMELDTTTLFDSPLLRKNTNNKIKGVARWDLEFSLIPGTVYYWRVGSENLATNEVVWRNSSFVYEPSESTGWNQSHFYQFQKNDYENLEYEDRTLKFVDNVKEISMQNGNPLIEFRINSNFWDRWRQSINTGIALVVFDPVLGNALKSYPATPLYGSKNTIPSGFTHYIEFPTDTEEQRALVVSVLRDSIPVDYIVAVNFVQKPNLKYPIESYDDSIPSVETSIFKFLETEGALRLLELQSLGAVPYTFVYKKGQSKVLAEEYVLDGETGFEALYQIKTLWDRGEITSQLIGPSSSWGDVVWDVEYSSIAQNDTVSIDIIGFGNPDDLGEVLEEKLTAFTTDISSIDPIQYPYLKLRFSSKDVRNLSTAQLTKLRVHYIGMTDLTLDPEHEFLFYNKEMDEGDKLKINLGVANYSGITSPETDITYTIINNKNEALTFTNPIKSLQSGERTTASFEYNTRGLFENNTIQIELNKSDNPSEIYRFNNFAISEFEVKPDTVNPLLYVTFDGVQIMSEDIVSAEPMIRMELSDNNKFLLLDDPSSFIITLTDPEGNMKQILADDPNILFIPAESSQDNKSVIEYNPSLEIDGRYTLTAQSKDATGNSSGSLSYEVDFRVYNEEMVSNVFNYPNPFSTSTQFIFTLTGNEEPSNVLVRIMTLSGKVVREITTAELGPLRIGMNKSEYRWDGRDEFGDKLGNGTYLYQVITKKMDGSDYDHFSDPTQNNTDFLFKDGFGKLVIIR